MSRELTNTTDLDVFQAATGYFRRPGWGMDCYGDSRMAVM